jgi:tetratricopeptide (TPR) repeat protein
LRRNAAVFLTIVVCLAYLAVADESGARETAERLFEERYADHIPAWCLYTQALPDGTLSPFYGHGRSEDYRKHFGPTWSAMHHYCFGLEAAYLASSEDNRDRRRHHYRQAVLEFDYVLARSPDDFVLKPDLYTEKGAALEAIEDHVGAVESYTEAVRLDHEHEPAYLGLSSCFEELDDPQTALEIVQVGLQRIAGSDALRVREEKLQARVSARR